MLHCMASMVGGLSSLRHIHVMLSMMSRFSWSHHGCLCFRGWCRLESWLGGLESYLSSCWWCYLALAFKLGVEAPVLSVSESTVLLENASDVCVIVVAQEFGANLTVSAATLLLAVGVCIIGAPVH